MMLWPATPGGGEQYRKNFLIANASTIARA